MWADLARAAWDRAGESSGSESRMWLERARRIAPTDAAVALNLGLACLNAGDAAAAAALFEEVLQAFDLLEARTGLAASALRLGQPARAEAAMQAALSRTRMAPVLFPLAAAVARAASRPGWCAMGFDGQLHASIQAELTLDGSLLRPRWSGGRCRIPPGNLLHVTRSGIPLLGSPIDLAALNEVEGFVQTDAGGLSGWAWFPNDPERDPVLAITGDEVAIRVTARDALGSMAVSRPLARPRSFRLAADMLSPGLVHVTGEDGRDLLGSPLHPGAEWRSAAGLDGSFRPVWADVAAPARTALPRRRRVDVVVPVYGGLRHTMDCLGSVLAALPAGSRLHIVDDASPDPGLAAALVQFARKPGVKLIRLERNAGFPAAANMGLAAAAGRDAVLLNSDTLVTPGWLEALVDAVYSAPDIGTACPLSNEATILSYPRRDGSNPMPSLAETAAHAALAQRANGAATVDIPTGVGFCMLIRRDCLDATGPFREDLFAQGYGEENDFCLRARHRGWRHVAVPGAFVAHRGGASFAAAQQHLQARNAAVLGRLHPGYPALIAEWQGRDPLGPARRAMDALRWRAEPARRTAILVTHAGGGGVDRVVAARAAALRGAGIRPVVLRPDGAAVVIGDEPATPNLRFTLPLEWLALVRFLRASRPLHVELHHTLGHNPGLLGLAEALSIPHEVFVHDYSWFCPRIALVPQHGYCGEPDIAVCEACVADHGSNLEEDISVPDLVRRSAAVLGSARRVVTPSADVAVRMRRHFPGTQAEVAAWEDDRAVAPPASGAPAGDTARVCVIGGIGVEKGFDVLLACVRDAAARRLPISFTVVGYTADDDRLLNAGPVFITGQYSDAEAVALIAAQRADLAFLPSIWPETWCFTLSLAWRAGLRAAVFDIGTPAERVRRTGWGWVLPLGLPPAALNDWVMRERGPTAAPFARCQPVIWRRAACREKKAIANSREPCQLTARLRQRHYRYHD